MKLEKTTKTLNAARHGGYEDACGLAHALELIGDRWTPLVLRELAIGPRRFSELRTDLPGISANVLTQRLGELEERGLVRRRKLPPPASVQVYEATQWALDARPILCALGRWASRSPLHDPSHPVSPVAIMLSMQTNIDSTRAGDFAAKAVFRFATASFALHLSDGGIDLLPGETDFADFTVTTTANALKPVLYGGAPPDTLAIDGNIEMARQFFTLFSLPPKAVSSSVEATAASA